MAMGTQVDSGKRKCNQDELRCGWFGREEACIQYTQTDGNTSLGGF